MPGEASPGGTEGVEPGWQGGSSNTGEVLHQPEHAASPYSMRDVPDAARRESVRAFVCNECGEVLETEANLNVHRRTHHRPR